MKNYFKPQLCVAILLFTGCFFTGSLCAQPALPPGLEEPVENADDSGLLPALPEGLGEDAFTPALPEGLGDTPQTTPQPDETSENAFSQWLGLTGFWEVRGGLRTQKDPHEKDASLGETRLQLGIERMFQKLRFKVTADFVYDPVLDRNSVNLDTGQGWVDLREAWVGMSPLSFMDVRVGRQILTWGTGDLIFINDMFPKDWQSFFIGRDLEYLKAPSDAVKVSMFWELANLDIVYTPSFDSDRYIRGRRISYYNDTLARRAGQDAVVDADERNEWFKDDEIAARLSKTVGGYELAAYGYWGYWKSPAGINPATMHAIFPRLNVYGASARGQFAGGITNVEAGYYDSQDSSGTDPFIDNSQFRFLVGYSRDVPQIARDLTVGVQYYLEHMCDYDQYRRNLPAGFKPDDENRHVVTFRVTKLLMNQNLTLSLFAFYSPSDSDAYLRPNLHYKIDDNWSIEMGANVFFGADRHTFFNQFARNNNIYGGLRYSF